MVGYRVDVKILLELSYQLFALFVLLGVHDD